MLRTRSAAWLYASTSAKSARPRSSSRWVKRPNSGGGDCFCGALFKWWYSSPAFRLRGGGWAKHPTVMLRTEKSEGRTLLRNVRSGRWTANDPLGVLPTKCAMVDYPRALEVLVMESEAHSLLARLRPDCRSDPWSQASPTFEREGPSAIRNQGSTRPRELHPCRESGD